MVSFKSSILLYFLFLSTYQHVINIFSISFLVDASNLRSEINVAAVVCKDETRVKETLVNFKSILIHTSNHIKFHVFTENDFMEMFTEGFNDLQQNLKNEFEYHLHPIQYPKNDYDNKWKKLFKPCASQRLFIPYILKDVDSILYVDTDVLFLTPIENLWQKLYQFNSTQLASMAPEHEETNTAWYSRFARHPYYGLTGINSGVMLMNMSRIRMTHFKNNLSAKELSWIDMMLPLYKKYQWNITWGDQDLLNIIFHFNPEMLLELDCNWNYRPDHCMYMPLCESAKQHGVQVLHGCRRAFHNDKWPIFKLIYQIIDSFDIKNNFSTIWEHHTYQNLTKHLSNAVSKSCFSSSEIILKAIKDKSKDLHTEL